ncbi:MAG: signal peptidase, partial [Enterococcus thailandicus]|nr:signal peptidase [Enterococcus thailandicus]
DFGKMIETPDGKGKVVGLNLLSRLVKVRLTGRENPVEYEWDELKDFIQVGEMNG